MSSWWGTIFDKSHREGHYNGSHYFIQKELFYGSGGYSVGYHQGGHYFCKGSQVSIWSFFYRIMTWGLLFYGGGGHFTLLHQHTTKPTNVLCARSNQSLHANSLDSWGPKASSCLGWSLSSQVIQAIFVMSFLKNKIHLLYLFFFFFFFFFLWNIYCTCSHHIPTMISWSVNLSYKIAITDKPQRWSV